MNRGDHREPIFHDAADREQFLATLGETCHKAVWDVHAYCFMPNHFHLVIETPQGSLVAGMQWLLGTYTGPVQSPAEGVRPPSQQSLQGVDRGRQRGRLPEDGVRLRAFESGARAVADARGASAGVSLEQETQFA